MTSSDVDKFWNEYRHIQSDANELHSAVDVHYYENFEQKFVAHGLKQDLNIDMTMIPTDGFAAARALIGRFSSIYASMIWFVVVPGAIFFAIVRVIEVLARVA